MSKLKKKYEELSKTINRQHRNKCKRVSKKISSIKFKGYGDLQRYFDNKGNWDGDLQR